MIDSTAHNILILSSDTGGGHRSAAAAIVAGMEKFNGHSPCNVHVVRAVEESDAVAARLVHLYNWLLRHRQQWMRYLYWAMNRIRPETREFFYSRCVGYVHDLLSRFQPHVLVSVHPLTLHVVGRALSELNLADTIPLVCVVTDPCYGFWKAWACPAVTLYLVASDEAARQLIDYGVSPDRIRISGMPIHPRFNAADRATAQSVRSALRLHPEKFTVLLNAGCEGGGNILRIFRELIRGRLDAQAVFLAGRNEELRAAAEALASQDGFPATIVGYSERIEQLMNAADVMVSKSGGLTTFEALSCRVPIITDGITRPMPQELGTAKLIVRQGAGVLLERAQDIVPVVRRMIEDRAHHSAMREAAAGLVLPNAIRRIVQEITGLLPTRSTGSSPQSRSAERARPSPQVTEMAQIYT